MQHKLQPLSKTYSVPGKIFILGEYAVLAGLPALVAAVGSRFHTRVDSIPSRHSWHPSSPVARYLDWAKKQGLPEVSFSFSDPYEGAGGFGASTAQFALAYQMISGGDSPTKPSWKEVWALYRELMNTESLLPSGADLVAQWEGGVVLLDPTQETCENLGKNLEWSQISIFSATHQPGRKVPTHEHLKKLSSEGFPKSRPRLISALGGLIQEGIHSIQSGDLPGLGRVMSAYAEELRCEGCEVRATTEDRRALSEHPDVLGVKGTGALQSDALIVLTQQGGDRSSVIALAQKRGLRLICEGITFEMGLRCDNKD